MRSIKLPSWTERLLGLTPVPVPPHVFALEPERLRYARFHSGSNGLELREHLTVDLEPGMLPDGPLAGAARDANRLGEAIEALISESSTALREASLVLPDRWLRVAFAEAEDVPPRGAQREQVIRFKLRRLVPFRVEDLRVSAAEVPGLDRDGSERRLILGFASEGLVAQFEDLCAQHGVRIGQVTNQSLALLSALGGALRGGDGGILVHATADGYCLVVTRHGQPVLHRHKQIGEAGGDLDLVLRDLRLTQRFVTQQLGAPPRQVIFVGPARGQSEWQRALESTFEAPVLDLAREWGEIPGTVSGVPVDEAAVLLGAASRRVS